MKEKARYGMVGQTCPANPVPGQQIAATAGAGDDGIGFEHVASPAHLPGAMH